MTGLFGSELLRLRSRLGVMALLCGAMTIFVLLMLGQVAAHEDDFEQARATWRAERIQAYPDELASYRLTLSSIGDKQMPVGHREVTIEEYANGTDFSGVVTQVPTRRFNTAALMPEMTKIATVLLALTAYMVGSTYAGADWQNRTLPALLTWESRRVRVFATKATAVAVVSASCLVVAQAVGHVLGFAGGVTRGTTDGLNGSWWVAQGWAVARGALVVGVAGVVGLALAFLGRLTSFALGVGLAYLAVFETFLLSVRPEFEPFTVRGAVSAFLDGGGRVVLPHSDGPPQVILIGTAGAFATIGAYVMVTASAALLAFRQRDIA